MVPCGGQILEVMGSADRLTVDAPSVGRARTSRARDRLHLLVIDDQADPRYCVARLLQTAGYTVEEAASGDEGVRRLQTVPPDVVLTDLLMPGLSGWDVVRAAHVLRPGLPVLVMTGCPDALEASQGAETLAAGILHKPFRMKELLDRLAALSRTDSDAAESRRPTKES